MKPLRLFYGTYRLVGSLWIWEPNPALKMLEEEQLKRNLEDPDFSITKPQQKSRS